MTQEIRLGGSVLGCTIDVLHGARLSSLRTHGRERLVPYERGLPSTAWGAYPMVPFAGRIRNGRFIHEGVEHHVARNHGRHAIHGTVFSRSWTTLERSEHHAIFVVGLGARWPFIGNVTHEVSVDVAAGVITCTLTVATEAESMPAQVGWHPWFVRPVSLTMDFAEMYVRDDDHIPTGRRIAPGTGPFDDCFVGARQAPVLEFADGGRIELHSDCDHWVIYDEPAHALCVEPQSGPPDGVNIAPHVITPSTPLQRSMKLIVR